MWCMRQYKNLFNTCKVPGISKDQLISYFKTEEEGACPSHYTVIRHGRIYKFETHHENGELLTAPEMEVQLQRIKDDADKQSRISGVGALTSENRTTWAKVSTIL